MPSTYTFAELGNALRRQREAYSVRVSTETGEQFAAALESLQQMKCRNGTAGAVALTILSADYKGRTVGALNHSCGGNADHSAMPAVTVEHDTASVSELRFDQALFERLHDLLLALLTIGVELIQPPRQLACFIFFLGLEEFNYRLCHIHASGSVHPRSDAESDI